MLHFLRRRDIRSVHDWRENCKRKLWHLFLGQVSEIFVGLRYQRIILVIQPAGAYVPINPTHKSRNVAIGQRLSYGDPFSKSPQSSKSTPGPGNVSDVMYFQGIYFLSALDSCLIQASTTSSKSRRSLVAGHHVVVCEALPCGPLALSLRISLEECPRTTLPGPGRT